MTRYHFFNAMYPMEANKISEGYSTIGKAIWNTFATITMLDKLFVFTPKELILDPDEVSGE